MKGPENSTLIRVDAWCLAALTLGCGGTDPPENRAPVAVGSIPALTIDEREEVSTSVAAFFSDPDGDTLAYTAESDDDEVADTELVGAELLIHGVGPGTATITVTATDPDGASVSQMAEITIRPLNRAPMVTDSLEALEWEVDTFFVLFLSNHFTDPDGDALTYEAVSSDEDIVELELDDGELEMYGVDVGVATVTITATDPGGLTATMSFTATIVEG